MQSFFVFDPLLQNLSKLLKRNYPIKVSIYFFKNFLKPQLLLVTDKLRNAICVDNSFKTIFKLHQIKITPKNSMFSFVVCKLSSTPSDYLEVNHLLRRAYRELYLYLGFFLSILERRSFPSLGSSDQAVPNYLK